MPAVSSLRRQICRCLCRCRRPSAPALPGSGVPVSKRTAPVAVKRLLSITVPIRGLPIAAAGRRSAVTIPKGTASIPAEGLLPVSISEGGSAVTGAGRRSAVTAERLLSVTVPVGAASPLVAAWTLGTLGTVFRRFLSGFHGIPCSSGICRRLCLRCLCRGICFLHTGCLPDFRSTSLCADIF